MASHKLRWLLTLTLCTVYNLCVCAQDGNGKVEMADTFRSNGKIYVVVAVCLTILIGLLLYVALLDKKIQKIEKSGSAGPK